MKLVQLFKIYWPDNGGGIASVMDMVSCAFAAIERERGDQGHRQEIVVCRPYPQMPSKHDRYHGVDVYRCRSFADIASTPFSFEFLKRGYRETKDADVVIYHFPYPMVDLGVLLGLYRGKLLVWWHCDFDTQKSRILTKLYGPLVRHTLKKADAVIVSAKGNIRGSRALWPFRKKCYMIPFAVGDEIAEQGKRYYREKKQISVIEPAKRRVHILFIGRFVWYKGIDILLKAFCCLDEEDYELTLVGDGPLLHAMQSLAEELELKFVTFAGSVSEEEKIEWIKWSDFLVLPSVSKAEAFAIVQIEAMAFGKPVINTKIPSGVPDVCPDGISGITVNPGSETELWKAMKKLGEDMELREKYGIKAMELVEKRYRMSVLEARYKKLMEIINK